MNLCVRDKAYSLIRSCIFTLALVLISFQSGAEPSPITNTQTKLRQLDNQIKDLRHTLATATDKKSVLNQELSNTEKQIGTGVRTLLSIEHSMSSKKIKIAQLQNKIASLNNQLKTQQQLLASHVRARYQMGEYQPLKWLLNQDDPYKINRISTYYQHIVKSRQKLIGQIDVTRSHLNENKKQLDKELAKTQILQGRLAQNQQQLKQNKTYHTALIHSLDEHIQNQQQQLQDAQRDKDNLTKLLQSLAQQSIVQSSKPFIQMRKKLPLPVQTKHKSIRRMNQGVTFFADEGAVVTAVYPGKIVFSDWLKGYGLLLIIDHGQGFMTLYAHNQSLFKRKGQVVSQNEQIARVGHSGGIKQNGLYFEIRQRGKAVSPLEWLS